MRAEPFTELPTSILGLMRWIGIAQFQGAERALRESGLTTAQGRTLGYIEAKQDEGDGVFAKDLARISGTTPASISSLLQGLEKRELIERRDVEGDERRKRLYVLPDGAALIAAFDRASEESTEQVLAILDSDERETLRALLHKVAEQIPPLQR